MATTRFSAEDVAYLLIASDLDIREIARTVPPNLPIPSKSQPSLKFLYPPRSLLRDYYECTYSS